MSEVVLRSLKLVVLLATTMSFSVLKDSEYRMYAVKKDKNVT
jgi:hypothetical protein